jgi:hypothetical protein
MVLDDAPFTACRFSECVRFGTDNVDIVRTMSTLSVLVSDRAENRMIHRPITVSLLSG